MKRGIYNKFWSVEDVAILRFLYPNCTNVFIADFLGKKEGAIIAKSFKLRLLKDKQFLLECSQKGQFKSGNIPFNKGLSWDDYMTDDAIKNSQSSQFKPGEQHVSFGKSIGNISFYVGSLWITSGYKERRLYSHYQYEKFIGDIPESHIVTFKDGNPKNCHPFNLLLISRRENMERNTIQRYPPELISTLKTLSKLKKIIKNYGTEQIS